MKTFKCVICGKEVSRRKSYAYKDGRACREHPEVIESRKTKEIEQERFVDLRTSLFANYIAYEVKTKGGTTDEALSALVKKGLPPKDAAGIRKRLPKSMELEPDKLIHSVRVLDSMAVDVAQTQLGVPKFYDSVELLKLLEMGATPQQLINGIKWTQAGMMTKESIINAIVMGNVLGINKRMEELIKNKKGE